MLDQNREGVRCSGSPAVDDEDSDRVARSGDESTERCATGWERREILARAREDAGARIVHRSAWSMGDPGAA